jgi:2-methylcitrate dehydratase PrpD
MSPAPESLLCDYVVQTGAEDPDPDSLEKAVHCLIDSVTLAAAAKHHHVVRAVESLASDATDGARAATTWTSGRRVSLPEAFLINGTAAHAFFQDDTDMDAWAHPGSLVPPVAFALAEADGLGLRQALRGLIVGYTTLNWLAANEEVARQIVERGFRASPVLGTMAAAAAAAATLRLNTAEVLSAIGIAADATGGVLEPVGAGAEDWRLQNGMAAQRGGMAALLARQGVRGPEFPLTGAKGFLAAFADGKMPAGWREKPASAAIARVWFKPYPTLGDNMAPVVAAAYLSPRIDDIDAVTSVTIWMNAHFAAYPGTQFTGPFERTEQMIGSTAFAVAAVLVHGDLHYRDYETLLRDRRVLNLVAKTSIRPVADLDYLDGKVEVATAGGSVVGEAADAGRHVFFRDRQGAAAVVRDRLGSQSHLSELLFGWLDGDDDQVAPGSVLAQLRG